MTVEESQNTKTSDVGVHHFKKVENQDIKAQKTLC